MLLPGRNDSEAASDYRYSFQGQEHDDEVKGRGNYLNFVARGHDPRIGRFFTGDPLEGNYPWQSTYAFAANSPIELIDYLGMGPTDWVKGSSTGNKWEWDADVKDEASAKAIYGDDAEYAAPGHIYYGVHPSGNELGKGCVQVRLGERGYWEIGGMQEEVTPTVAHLPKNRVPDDLQSFTMNLSDVRLPSDGYSFDQKAAREAWGTTQSYETFANGLHTGLLFVGGGVLGAEGVALMAPMVQSAWGYGGYAYGQFQAGVAEATTFTMSHYTWGTAAVVSTNFVFEFEGLGSMPGSKSPGKWSVGSYKTMKGSVPGLDAHHVGQKAIMNKLIPGYNMNTAPTILVPKVGHTVRGPNGIVSRSTKGLSTPRAVIARDIFELRRVYGSQGIPNSSLQELIKMNKEMYPNSFIKK